MVLIRTVSSADGAVVTGQFKIRMMYVNGSAASTVVLKNGAGTIVWQGNTAAAADLQVIWPDEGLFLNGMQFTTVTAATIFLYQ